MEINKFGQVIISEDEAIEAIYEQKIISLDNVYFNDSSIVAQFNNARRINADPFPNITEFIEPNIDISEFDKLNQQIWFMPKEYQEFDIETWVMEQCDTDIKINRVQTEFILFHQLNIMDLLRYLKYLVDTMRANNILWGVGRGSSVASYVLYIIGIHKIDSIRYGLDIKEFLRT